jgi:amidase/aspartyl-tRNA(Asn)/glutamyl-tRNA(Gln) amidotransferase subunit A
MPGAHDICFTPARELAALIRRRALSPVEVVDAFLQRIEAVGARTNAYVTVTGDAARADAVRAQAAVMSGAPLGPLHGVPVAIKDMVPTAGVRTTLGCRAFADWVPEADGREARVLRAAGAIVLGKTNTPEFAARGTTDNLLFGPTSTPFATGFNAGGSSGGAAAAVADGLAALAQGSDGGGSIRIPAACCGVYGIKATYGRVPAGSRPNAWFTHTPNLQSGPIGRSVEDAALMLGVLAAPDTRDPLALPNTDLDPLRACAGDGSLEGLRVGFSADLGDFPVDPEVARVVADAAGAFAETGATVEPVAVDLGHPHEELAQLWRRQVGVLYAIDAALFARAGIDITGERGSLMTAELLELIELGRRQTAVEHRLDDTIRTDVLDAIEDLFETVDLLVCPTLGALPPRNATDGDTLGPREIAGRPVDPGIGWCLTYPFNFSGHPAASVPAGLAGGRLPVGLQIVGRRFADATVLRASAAFERVRPWHHTYPALAGAIAPGPGRGDALTSG